MTQAVPCDKPGMSATSDAPEALSATWSARVEPLGTDFPIPAGTTILEAARHAGIRLPSSCRNGTCRACLCQLVSGSVRYRVQWPGVSPDERDAGAILPCVAEAESDLILEVPLARRLIPAAR